MRLFKSKFAPDLINLQDYEKDLLYQKRHGMILQPVPFPCQLLFGSYSPAEEQAMDDNRKAAQAIYDAIVSE